MCLPEYILQKLEVTHWNVRRLFQTFRFDNGISFYGTDMPLNCALRVCAELEDSPPVLLPSIHVMSLLLSPIAESEFITTETLPDIVRPLPISTNLDCLGS